MSENLIDRLEEKYGPLGLFILVISAAVLIATWFIVSIVYTWPVFAPVIICAYMIWSIRK